MAPLAALAQAPAPAPSYYVGAGLYTSAFQNLGYHYGLTTVPVQVLGGYRWRPRWAVQLGAAYNGNSTDYRYRSIDPNNYTYDDIGHATDRRLSLTLQLRRTLTRQLAHRVQFDALGGLTYEHGAFRGQGLYTVASASQPPASQPYDSHDQYNGLLAGLGLGVRVRVVAPLEVTFDYALNAALTETHFGSTISSAAALGVRYSFGGLR